jgi:hypothetical protein
MVLLLGAEVSLESDCLLYIAQNIAYQKPILFIMCKNSGSMFSLVKHTIRLPGG